MSSVIKGETIASIHTLSGKLARTGLPGKELLNPTEELIITEIRSKGKVIFMELVGNFGTKRATLISTLGMSGWWYPDLNQVGTWADQKVYSRGKLVTVGEVILAAGKHTRARITTVSGKIMNYVDPRNFGNLTVVHPTGAIERYAALGIDAFELKYCSKVQVTALLRERSAELGQLLLDQSVISGIGNIYRAEILYLALLNPLRYSGTLQDYEIDNLIAAIDHVVNTAYRTHGTMSYPLRLLSQHGLGVNTNLIFGSSLAERGSVTGHLVYGRETDLFGNQVKSDQSGGRTLWWCPTVQV